MEDASQVINENSQPEPAQDNYIKHEQELINNPEVSDAELAHLTTPVDVLPAQPEVPVPVAAEEHQTVVAAPDLTEPPKELDVASGQLVTDVAINDHNPEQQLIDAGHIPPAKEEEDEDDIADQLSKYPPSVIVATKLLIGSWLLKGAKPVVPGTSSPDPSEKSLFNIEVRFLYGRRRVKYEINQPGARLMIDYDFSAISGLAFKLDTNIMVVELSEPPSFSALEEGKWVKVLDFTQGNASYYRRHYIEFHVQNFSSHVERLLEFDARLKQLAEYGLAEISTDPSFAAAPPNSRTDPNSAATSQTLICDWDRENIALLHCVECGSQSYCAECDEVLHRPHNKRGHKRISTTQMAQAGVPVSPHPASGGASPTQQHNHTPSSHVSGYQSPGSSGNRGKKRKQKKKSERCRCGTGATKGTLGEPCTGNRCPCYSEGRGCSACGCKNCRNPHNDREDKPSHEVDHEAVAPMVSL